MKKKAKVKTLTPVETTEMFSKELRALLDKYNAILIPFTTITPQGVICSMRVEPKPKQ